MTETAQGFVAWAEAAVRLGRAYSVPYASKGKCSVEVHFPEFVTGYLFFRPKTIVARLDSGADVCVFSRADLEGVGASLTSAEECDVDQRSAIWLADNCGVAGSHIVRTFQVGNCRFGDVKVFVPMVGEESFYELCRQLGRVPRKGEVNFSTGEVRGSVLGLRGILDKAVLCLDQKCVHFFAREDIAGVASSEASGI